MKKQIMKTFIKKNTWLIGINCGWGNGYVIIPPKHPLNGVPYKDINVEVHGELTFSEKADDLKDWPEITKEDKGGWVVGFDTAHIRDTLTNWPKESVEKETKRLLKQIIAYKPK